MSRLLYDIETDGLSCNWVNCLVIKDIDTGKVYRYRKTPEGSDIVEGVKRLNNADMIIGHNIIKFDNPTLTKIYEFKPKGLIRDTLVISRLIWTDLKGLDMALVVKGRMNRQDLGQFFGKHSLDAWGYRLKNYKADWEHKEGQVWSQEMEDYCVQDVEVNHALWQLIESKNYSEEAIQLENDVQEIVYRQEQRGIGFDLEKAKALHTKLVTRRLELEAELQKIFPPFYLRHGKVLTPKSNNKRWHYVKGARLQKIKLHDFNPGSRDHIADRLIKTRGWRPNEWTNEGKPKVDENILSQLDILEAPVLVEYLTVNKRLGQLAEGKEAWLKRVGEGGRIHGRVNTNGTRTGRMSHHNPNLAQVPAAHDWVPYGAECRDLFIPTEGWKLVGGDAASLELRCLAHYMARYDGGAYIKVVLEGDPHTTNMKAAGLDNRDKTKRWFYAMIYGAGNALLGAVVNGTGSKQGKPSASVGSKSRKKFMRGLPAFGSLYEEVQKIGRQRGHLLGIDGRHLILPSLHSALNTLLQSAGAIIMKKALVLCDQKLQKKLVPGVDYEFVLNVHDEQQIESLPEHTDACGKAIVEAIQEAGKHFNFRCPLDGEYKVGDSWKETH